jgi:hypothetical protein
MNEERIGKCLRQLEHIRFLFVYVEWCPTLIVLCFCFVSLRLVYPMLLLARKLLNEMFLLVKLKSSLRTFYGRHYDLVDRYGISQTFFIIFRDNITNKKDTIITLFFNNEKNIFLLILKLSLMGWLMMLIILFSSSSFIGKKSDKLWAISNDITDILNTIIILLFHQIILYNTLSQGRCPL